jgi:radical SAM superfamily enzyme
VQACPDKAGELGSGGVVLCQDAWQPEQEALAGIMDSVPLNHAHAFAHANQLAMIVRDELLQRATNDH